MPKKLTTLLLAMMLGLGTLTLAACGNDDGAAGKAGDKMGNAADKAGDSMGKAGDKMKDSMKDAGGASKDKMNNMKDSMKDDKS